MSLSLPLQSQPSDDQLYHQLTDHFITAISNTNTRETYRRHIYQFFQWCKDKDYPIATLKEDVFAEYIQFKGGMSPSTEQQVAALRKLFDYLVSASPLIRNPVPQISRQRSRKPLKNADETLQVHILALIRSIPEKHAVDLRDRALLAVLVFTNLRVTEIKELHVEDYVITSDGAHIHYSKQLTFDEPYRLPNEAKKYVDIYLNSTQINDQKELPLFRRLKRNGELTDKRLSRGGINAIVSQRTGKSILNKKLAPKALIGLLIELPHYVEGPQKVINDSGELLDGRTTHSPHESTKSISVYIIEDHELYSRTVQEIINLEPDLNCKHVFHSFEDYLRVFHDIPSPDVLLVDRFIPGKMDGLEGIRRIRALNPIIKIIVLTNSESSEHIFDAISSGAVGYITKDEEPEMLTAKIREASNGGLAMSSRAARKMQRVLEDEFKSTEKEGYVLTPREKEVLRYMVEGKSRKEIAVTLFISTTTVDTHVQNVYRKLEVNSSIQAVRKEYMLGLERMRLKIAQSLHDDVGASLATIAIQLSMMESRLKVSEKDKARIQRLGAMVRQTGQAVRETGWVINSKHDSLFNLVGQMREQALLMLDGRTEYTFTQSPTPMPEQLLEMDFKHNMYFAYKEAIFNAIKYSQASLVRIKVTFDQQILSFRVEDNGDGFDTARIEEKGGLNNMKERAQEIGGTFDVLSSPGKGTVVSLQAPVIN